VEKKFEGESGIGDLELFFKIVRERVVGASEMESYEVERMRYWVQEGMVSLRKRKDVVLRTEDEYIFSITKEGTNLHKKILEYAYQEINSFIAPAKSKYFSLIKLKTFLQPSSKQGKPY
jgi:hypothetical protein